MSIAPIARRWHEGSSHSADCQIMTLRIVATSVLILICYFIVGLQMAVVPGFVHWRLGYNPVAAGLAVSVQYVATLLSRPIAGVIRWAANLLPVPAW